jgi:pSer/pThr/pTyr-binding forkhead associated (FHA) protein
MIKQIDASDGFVADDGTSLSEMREQLIDEALNYEKRGSADERAHQLKGSMTYSPTATPTAARAKRKDHAPGFLVGLSHDAQNRKWQLFGETAVGRSMDNEIPIHHPSLSRRHARLIYMNGNFVLTDLGSTNGCELNGQAVYSQAMQLKDGDIVKIGEVEFRLDVKKP